MYKVFIILVFCFALTATSALAQGLSRTTPNWATGFWRLTDDEDQLGISDVVEFRADGSWINYTPRCGTSKGQYLVHGNDLVMLREIKKGGVALVFRPNSDRTKLVFTSPRTQNNSIYTKVLSPSPCRAAE